MTRGNDSKTTHHSPLTTHHLKARLIVGTLLIGLASGVLFFDPAPWYPFLLTLLLLLALAAAFELRSLLDSHHQPPLWFLYPALLAVLLAGWPTKVGMWSGNPWEQILATFVAVLLLAFLIEMARFRQPGQALPRLALTLWIIAYLGILPAFLAQLRWWTDEHGSDWPGAGALALTIFVPKFGDIGAYFAGHLLGRHRMSPTLSPNKTWEGLAGGLVLSALTALALNFWVGVLGPPLWAVAFGVSVGIAGVLGDLAESLIKRDVQRKDASQVIPGFGGVLDLIDSIVFAAPLAYLWLKVLLPWLEQIGG
jgi:phosphatidate cytidylyltransferase